MMVLLYGKLRSAVQLGLLVRLQLVLRWRVHASRGSGWWLVSWLLPGHAAGLIGISGWPLLRLCRLPRQLLLLLLLP